MYNFSMPPPPAVRDCLTDGHISVRRYRAGDEAALYQGVCESIAELTRWGFYHPGFSQEDAAEDVASRISSWRAGESFTYLIEQLPGRVFLGNCRIEEYEPELNHAALGWWVRTGMTGQGIGTAAARRRKARRRPARNQTGRGWHLLRRV
jgi:RimJ/RimL family protein N-acetyltransferase